MNEYILINLITFFIDIFLIYFLINVKLNTFDTYFIKSALFVHLIFYIALYFNIKLLIDLCHYLIGVYFFISLKVKSKYILSLLIILLLIIEYLWHMYKKCILNKISQPLFMTNDWGDFWSFSNRYFIVFFFTKILVENNNIKV